MKHTHILVLLVVLPFVSMAQSGRLKYADKLYSTMSYYYAAEAYEDVIARKTDSATVAKNLSSSYDKIGNTSKAIEWYRFLERNSQLDKDQQMRLALLEREAGNYKGSEDLMANYTTKYGESDVSRDVVASSSSIEALIKGTNNFELHPQNVNTLYSEIGATYYADNSIILASSKRLKMSVNTIDSWSGNYFYDLYTASIDEQGTIGKMKKINSKVTTKYHDGPAVYDAASGYFYFTRNNYLDGKKGTDDQKVVRLKIYRAKLDGSKFKNVQELAINSESFSTAHPTLSKDGKTMYFSSDRPGSLGGMDLYSIKLDDKGTVGEPVNLGSKINTTQNDVFPFYNEKENILFFSSEGHAGLGGLDVYVAKLKKSGEARKVENLGAPINSSADDLSYVSDEMQTKGYVSSNRNDGVGSDDIYGFKQLKPITNSAVFVGKTTDLLTGLDLENTTLYLADKNGNILDSTKSTSDGAFELDLNKVNGDFLIMASQDGYLQAQKEIAYQDDKMEYNEDVKLMPILEYYFTGTVVDKVTQTPLEGVKIAITDNKKKQNSEIQFTKSQGDFSSNTLLYNYEDNVDYQFKLEKEGYVTKSIDLKEFLGSKEAINVQERMSMINMEKIEIGKTNLDGVVALNPIYFDLNSSLIRKDAALELDKIIAVMKENPRMVIELGSHTDTRADDNYNLWLSDRRAKSSANYIISKGIGKDRITGKGYGETKLIVQDTEIDKVSTEEEKEVLHQKNRRTEFIVVKMK